MSEYKTLYKSVGFPEWKLIAYDGCSAFPRRLLMQPIFYPSFTFDYACKLAKEWNTIDSLSEYVGLVVAFDVPPTFFSEYQQLLESECDPNELWLPPEQLYTINSSIMGKIRVTEIFYGAEYSGDKYSTEQLNEPSFLI